MKALAHPVRMDLLELLATDGPHTASEAARRLGQTPANVSWHLRKLAGQGYVRQTRPGGGRARPWKVVAQSLSWGDDAEDPLAVAALHEVAVDREVQVLRSALARLPDEEPAWRAAAEVVQSRLWLTPQEAAALTDKLKQLLLERSERALDPDLRPAGARLMALMAWAVPAGPPTTGAGGELDHGTGVPRGGRP